jgi:hypothetical protein
MARGVKIAYTEDDLRHAVARSKSWRGVMRKLGYASTAGTLGARLRQHAEALGIDTSHFSSGYTEAQLRRAVASSSNWTQVQLALGRTPGSIRREVQAEAARLGLDSSHFVYKRSFRPVEAQPLPFGRPVQPDGRSGLSIAARWFLDRGYLVSVPLEPAPYDLVAESDSGLKRIQVKTTWQMRKHGRYAVQLGHQVRDVTAARNTNGHRRRVAYKPEEVDYFFMITPGPIYLIPIEAVVGQIHATLDIKYPAFAVESP